MISLNNLGDLIKHGYRLRAYCNNQECRHQAMLDLEALAARLGSDHSSLYPDIAGYLRCSACGGKSFSVTLVNPKTPGMGPG